MKNRFRRWIQSLKNSSLQSKISLFCLLFATIVYCVFAPLTSLESENKTDFAIFVLDANYYLFLLSSILFFFLTGYKKERALLCLVAIPGFAFPLYLVIDSMIRVWQADRILDLILLGIFLSLLFLAVASYNLGVLVRMIRYKNERKMMWLRIIIIVLSVLLVPIFIVLAMLSALGGGFPLA